MTDATHKTRVKFLTKAPPKRQASWRRQLPASEPGWGNCTFLFDPDARDYDWLVVYDELPPGGEVLACPREHTLLVTAEPPSIKVYGNAYLRQFGAVLTSHAPWALQHPRAIRSMPALQWFYGLPMHYGEGEPLNLDQLRALSHDDKPGVIATVCSNKQMGHTMHRKRYDFVQRLRAELPALDVYGHGVRPIADKAQAVEPYRYHLAIENHIGPDHITEKLTDAFLGGALPIYSGAPNAGDYFPPDSFIAIDIRRPDEAVATIESAIDNNEYEKRIDAIREAKRRVLDEYNLFALLAREIERLDTGQRGSEGVVLVNRRKLRRRNPVGALFYLLERYRVQARVKRESER